MGPITRLLTGQLTGDVKFTNDKVGPLFNDTALVFLTVDVQSNFPNNPTFVPLTFYNAKEDSNVHQLQFRVLGSRPTHEAQRKPEPDGAGHHRGERCYRAGGEGRDF